MKRPIMARFLYRVWRGLCRLRLHRTAGRVCLLIHRADGYCMARGGQFGQLCAGRKGHTGKHYSLFGNFLFGPVWRQEWD